MRTYYDSIMARKSIRGFTGEKLDVKGLIPEQLTGPFGHRVEINTADKAMLSKSYGTIKNGTNYLYTIASADLRNTNEIIDHGYCLEKAVIELTRQGYGTCWLGSGQQIEEEKEQPLIIPAYIVWGHAGKKRTLSGRMATRAGEKRLDFERLFFEGMNALSIEDAGAYARPLEAVRQAPSAYNRQPWRVLKEGNTLHFFKSSHAESHSTFCDLDMGIALCHFDLVRQEEGIIGHFIHQERKLSYGMYYTISFAAENL